MTIEEMHIAVNLGVQKIASFQVDNLLPQEIDHELNDAMDAFIKQRYTPMGNKYRKGFEQSQKRIDDLRALVVDGRTKCFYAGESISGFYIDRAPLPSDYMFLVNAISEGYYLCNSTIGYSSANFNYKQVKVSLTPPQPGYVLTKITVGDSAVLIENSSGMDLDYLSNLNNYSTTFSSQIVPSASNPNSEVSNTDTVYNTSFYNISSLANSELTPTSDSNTLILIASAAIYNDNPELKAVWKNPTTGAEYTPYPTHTFGATETITYRAYNGTGTLQRESMGFVQHDDLYRLLADPFNTTTYDKIKYTIQENFIDVHSDETFFTTFVDIKYIRQPKRMDKGSGVGCELAPHTHNEIVEMAISSILEAISDPRYNTQSREVLESE